jgi:L-asparagine oxygenase
MMMSTKTNYKIRHDILTMPLQNKPTGEHNNYIYQLPKTLCHAWQLDAESLMPNSDLEREFLNEIVKQGKQYLSDTIKNALKTLTQPDGPAFIMLQNMPIDPVLPSVPIDGKRPKTKQWVSEVTLLATAAVACLQPLGYQQEKTGQLVHNVAPSNGKEQSNSNEGRVPFGYHTDNSILDREHRPEFLMLLGLINHDQIPTSIVLLDDAIQALRNFVPHYEQVLRQDRFQLVSPESMNLKGKTILSKYQPLITQGANGVDEIAGNLYTIKPKDAEAKVALDAFISLLTPFAKQIVLRPGNLLIFNNHRCLHARAAITGQRWLQRLYCRQSLEELHKMTGTTKDCHSFDMRFLVL